MASLQSSWDMPVLEKAWRQVMLDGRGSCQTSPTSWVNGVELTQPDEVAVAAA